MTKHHTKGGKIFRTLSGNKPLKEVYLTPSPWRWGVTNITSRAVRTTAQRVYLMSSPRRVSVTDQHTKSRNMPCSAVCLMSSSRRDSATDHHTRSRNALLRSLFNVVLTTDRCSKTLHNGQKWTSTLIKITGQPVEKANACFIFNKL